MFTGIIEKIGRVQSIEKTNSAVHLVVDTGYADLMIGESVAINGVCLTVEKLGANGITTMDVSQETLRRTGLGSLKAGSSVNLERALLPTTRLSGHWVQGHVDGIAHFKTAYDEGSGKVAEFELGPELARYCVVKGSIALDGISLTIGALENLAHSSQILLRVFIIPHTWRQTHLHQLKAGASVNVEVDILAKYVEKLLAAPTRP